jgi:hypothetical protein
MALTPLRLLWKGAALLVNVLAGVAGVSVGVAVAILAVVAVFAAAAYDVYANWADFAGFFAEMWQGIKDIFGGWLDFLAGVFTGDMGRAADGLKRVWHGLTEFFRGLWGTIKQLFNDLTATLDGWTGGAISATFHAIGDAVGFLVDKFHELVNIVENGALARAFSFVEQHLPSLPSLPSLPQLTPPPGADGAAPGAGVDPLGLAIPTQAPAQAELTVRAAPGTQVTETRTSGSNWHFALPDMGQALGAIP